MSASACVYLDQVSGPLMDTVQRGLSMVAVASYSEVATTLGNSNALGDCCMLPERCPTLGSGMGW